MNNNSLSIEAKEQILDLRGTPCPINFVRTKLYLERLPVNTVLEVWLDGGEPIEQVPNSLRVEGYNLQSVEDCGSYFSILVSRSLEK